MYDDTDYSDPVQAPDFSPAPLDRQMVGSAVQMTAGLLTGAIASTSVGQVLAGEFASARGEDYERHIRALKATHNRWFGGIASGWGRPETEAKLRRAVIYTAAKLCGCDSDTAADWYSDAVDQACGEVTRMKEAEYNTRRAA